MIHHLDSRKYVVLISWTQNAVEAVREAAAARAGAVGAVLRVEVLSSGGEEGPQEEGVALDVVGAAIGVEDAAHPAVVAEDVEEGNASIPISMQCRYRSTICVSPCRTSPLNFHCRFPSLDTGWTQRNGSRRSLQAIPGQAEPPKIK